MDHCPRCKWDTWSEKFERMTAAQKALIAAHEALRAAHPEVDDEAA